MALKVKEDGTVDLNDLAAKIARREGKKEQVSIAQIKEVMRCFFEELNEDIARADVTVFSSGGMAGTFVFEIPKKD